MIGSAVGLGNIWRFPFVLYKNGGGAFYIPYLVALCIFGVPFLILEYAVGYNFKSSFAKGLRKINKKFEFLGWIIPLCTFGIMVYYSAVIGWIAIYIVLSFYNGWGDKPGQFFGETLLKSTEEATGLFKFVPSILLAMVICWVLIWFISHKQLEKGLGKVSKILVPLLFIIMIVIVIYSLTLDGASLGLSKLFKPDWSSLGSFRMWTSAFGQIVFSMSLGVSLGFTYAGYSGQTTDLISNAITIAITNSLFENFCALGVFSVVGHMMKRNTELSSLSGPGLVFIAYPEVINVLGKFGRFLGPAFFITVFLAGLTSILSMVEPISFCIQNKFNVTRKISATGVIIVGAILSLLFSTQYGSTLLDYVDTYINNVLALFCTVLECIIFSWVFDVKRVMKTLNARSKSIKVGTWWIVIIRFILPVCIAVFWVGSLIDTIKDGNVAKTIVFIITTLIMVVISAIFTIIKPTNKHWDEAENRL
ncbi:Na+-dependent transporter SNF family [Anaeromyces robustus]|uniref:Transporter n=1 Tax=Anaeromyces robustus TaxID=1754192 RepID=A0A1Y1X9P1_9FUNG|nr:Na+-dependent transporter SNF family [Anaeromyces robustus]|eukprot:ORX82462.1 Na+-dependent transporter SNF family [Anaeromyces robustus]